MTIIEASTAIGKTPDHMRDYLRRRKIARKKQAIGLGPGKVIDARQLHSALEKDGFTEDAESLMAWLRQHNRLPASSH